MMIFKNWIYSCHVQYGFMMRFFSVTRVGYCFEHTNLSFASIGGNTGIKTSGPQSPPFVELLQKLTEFLHDPAFFDLSQACLF